MRVLFIYPVYSYPRKSPPIGLASLAAYTMQDGHDVRILDLNVSPRDGTSFARELRTLNPDLIGVSFMTNQYGSALGLIARCREILPGAFLIAGGPHASALPAELMREAPTLNAVCAGEGEIPLGMLLRAMEHANPPELHTIPGLTYRDESSLSLVSNPEPVECLDLESAPWPAWQLLKLDRYHVFAPCGDPAKMTFAMVSSRGCPGQCIFCDSHSVFGRRFRARSAQNLLREVRYLHEEFGMEQFDFVDDLITLDRARILEFCDLLRASGTHFTWMANARIDTLDDEILSAMNAAGCVRIDVGVESGDPAVRKVLKKGISNERIVRVHRFCRRIGLKVGTFLMVGNLAETTESVGMTADLMKGLTDDPSISIACPYPGTELYRIAREQGYLLTEDWSKYVTAPTFVKDYQPVMRTDTMSAEEILDAYYYLVGVFAADKFRSRYGQRYYFNPRFIRDYLLSSAQYGGFVRKCRMALRVALPMCVTKFRDRKR
ncbi:MAG: radical SAM protein [Thermodesulfobacteriota bacterium]